MTITKRAGVGVYRWSGARGHDPPGGAGVCPHHALPRQVAPGPAGDTQQDL